MDDFRGEGERNKASLQKLVSLAEGYEKRVKEETELTKDQLKTRYVGKVDPKKRRFSYTFVTEGTMLTLLRFGRCWPATYRRQHCVCVTDDDRQGSLSTESWRKEAWRWRHGDGRLKVSPLSYSGRLLVV